MNSEFWQSLTLTLSHNSTEITLLIVNHVSPALQRLHRRVQALECIMGNQSKAQRNSKVCKKFKTIKGIHDMQFWVFYFPKQKICAQRCGRINLERMAIVESILLKRVSVIHFL